MGDLTLQELADETLMQKHLRVMREKCGHPADAIFASTFTSPEVSFTDKFCLDCGSHWRTDRLPTQEGGR